MAEPRVFISSTFYDLRHVRADLDWFIKDMGYVPIRNEGGDIPYGREDELEQYCYREIERCDIMIGIVGGRFGHASKIDNEYSISQTELKSALRLRKQVYVFVEKSVWHEYETYVSWPEAERTGFRPHHANDLRIHQFINEVVSLPKNNPIFEFESSHDIIDMCRRQWAGLLQSLLERQSRKPEEDLIAQLRDTLSIANQVVNYLSEEQKQGGRAVQDILSANHPAFGHLQRLLSLPFRVLFTNKAEFESLLKERGFRAVPEIEWISPDIIEYVRRVGPEVKFLKAAKSLFDKDGQLIVKSGNAWEPDLIRLEVSR
jgi:hypothetical protein